MFCSETNDTYVTVSLKELGVRMTSLIEDLYW